MCISSLPPRRLTSFLNALWPARLGQVSNPCLSNETCLAPRLPIIILIQLSRPFFFFFHFQNMLRFCILTVFICIFPIAWTSLPQSLYRWLFHITHTLAYISLSQRPSLISLSQDIALAMAITLSISHYFILQLEIMNKLAFSFVLVYLVHMTEYICPDDSNVSVLFTTEYLIRILCLAHVDP